MSDRTLNTLLASAVLGTVSTGHSALYSQETVSGTAYGFPLAWLSTGDRLLLTGLAIDLAFWSLAVLLLLISYPLYQKRSKKVPAENSL